MSLETNLIAALQSVCPRVFPDVAPEGAARPYITWQQLGGKPVNFTEGSTPTTRNALMQINVWSKTRLEANTLAQQIEDALRAAPALQAAPEGQLLAVYEDDPQLYGAILRFDIWAAR